MGSAGNGTPSHVSGELFKMMTGVTMQHVPYRSGGTALTDLLGVRIPAIAGRCRSCSTTRLPQLSTSALAGCVRWR
jgi:tripartite-type tricarboxylate transporter receptor subunit TctC